MPAFSEENIEEIFTGERFIPGIKDEQLYIEHYQRYISISTIVKDKIVVDAACGEGYGTYMIAKSAKMVYGIDIDGETITRATKKYKNENINFIESDITAIPLEENSVDVFISFETIEHITEELQNKFLNEIYRVLKEDGILIISTPNKEIYTDKYNFHNEFHKKEFYKEEFHSFLGGKFLNVELFHQFFEIVGVIDLPNETTELVHYEKNNKYEYNGKYLIGLASNSSLANYNLASIFMNTKNDYEEKNQRILTLQEEEEKRNKHIIRLDKEILIYRDRISELQDEIEKNNKYIEEINLKNSKLFLEMQREKNNFDKIINDKEVTINLLNGVINEKNSKINSINESINESNAKINESNAIINESNAKINEKDIEINKLNAILNDRNYIINQKDARIIDLEKRCIRIPKIIYRIVRKIKKTIRRIYEYMFPLYSKRRKFISENKNKICHLFVSFKTKKMYNIQKIDKQRNFPLINFPFYEEPIVSIIIPVYNQINYTYNCLKSLLNENKSIAYEIIVADDVSQDETAKMEEFVHGITVIRNEKNLGFLRNCNNAAKSARGKYILFLNNDTQVLENWLAPLVDLLEEDASVGMAGSKFIFPNGLLQEAGGIIWSDASGWNYGRNQDPTRSEYNYIKDVDYISGASIIIRKSLWEKIGGFDERYIPAYCEDSDLAFEVRKLGYRVVYQPLSQVIHYEGMSNGTDVNSGIKKYQVENNAKFKEKWKVELKEQYSNGENVFRARERSKNKKIILVIDHYVPTFDKDAGSKTTFQYLKMFVQKGFEVKFIGDNFFQSEPYTTKLQQMGIEVLYGAWYANNIYEWIKENRDNIQIAYLNRPHISSKYLDFLRNETNIKLIYYGHDLHYLRLKREYELTKNSNKLIESNEWMKKEIDIMHKANISYYPSCIEKEEILKIDPSISVKAIIAYVYDTIFEDICYDFTNREGLLFVGGFGHTPNIDAVLWFVNNIFPLIRKENNITFTIVGSNPPNEIKDIEREGVIIKGYVSDEELIELYKKCKMVVVPLRYGAGVKGKVIEALYYGSPIVTTSCGAEGIIDCDDIFVVADYEEDFANEVLSLYKNNTRLEKYSINAQSYIKKYFSIEKAWEIIEDDFK